MLEKTLESPYSPLHTTVLTFCPSNLVCAHSTPVTATPLLRALDSVPHLWNSPSSSSALLPLRHMDLSLCPFRTLLRSHLLRKLLSVHPLRRDVRPFYCASLSAYSVPPHCHCDSVVHNYTTTVTITKAQLQMNPVQWYTIQYTIIYLLSLLPKLGSNSMKTGTSLCLSFTCLCFRSLLLHSAHYVLENMY